jgi:hypothetical protein
MLNTESGVTKVWGAAIAAEEARASAAAAAIFVIVNFIL